MNISRRAFIIASFAIMIEGTRASIGRPPFYEDCVNALDKKKPIWDTIINKGEGNKCTHLNKFDKSCPPYRLGAMMHPP